MFETPAVPETELAAASELAELASDPSAATGVTLTVEVTTFMWSA